MLHEGLTPGKTGDETTLFRIYLKKKRVSKYFLSPGLFCLAASTGHSAHSKGDTVATAVPKPDVGSAHNFGRLLSSSPSFDGCIIDGVQHPDAEIQRCQVAPFYRSLLPLSVSDPSLF